jgi:putative transposase
VALKGSRPAPPNKLGPVEVSTVLATLNSARFVDTSPTQAYYVLLDEGTYIASVSTFYRALRANKLVRERRRQATHPPRVRPELVARRPNVVWSWDITKLKGPKKGQYYDLYVVLDIFSRYVVAWCVAPTESAELAKELIEQAISRHQVPPGQLPVHADRGSAMTSNQVVELYSFLGITRSYSRPHVSNDNPYSEAQFKTLKYCPAFPERFGCIDDARAFCARFFNYYNHEHRSIPVWATTRPLRSTTPPWRRSVTNGPGRSWPPTPPTQPASVTVRPSHRGCRRWHGSTSPSTLRGRPLRRFLNLVSQEV